MSGEPSKLRLVPNETPEELARRFEHETRPILTRREADLENSLDGFHVGSVPHLNAVPLARGLENQILYLPPSQLAVKLRSGELDAALLSVTEALFNEGYDVLDNIAIASLGEVKSVFLAHRQPLESMSVIHCDTASLASFNLLKVLLAEHGLHPELKPLPRYEDASRVDNVFMIGDHALDFLLAPHDHEIWDLGTAWFELTGLPFVFAVWTLRRSDANGPLRQALKHAKAFGMETLDSIIADRSEYSPEFRRDYLGWNIHYHLGSDERRGLAKFIELLRKHGMGPVHEPRFVA
jgi:chorismate dehydratase